MIIEKYLLRRINEAMDNIEEKRDLITREVEYLHDWEHALEQLYLEMQRVCTHPNEKTVLGYVYCDQCHKVLSEPGA